MSDELMDARLAEAGARWREANAVVADVDSVAFGGAAATEEGATFELPQPPRRTGVHPWPWTAGAAAVVALAVGLAVGLQGSGRHRGAETSADGGRPALLGTSWTLANFTPDGKDTMQPVSAAAIAFGADGSVHGNDGCGPFSSTSEAQSRLKISGTSTASNGDAGGQVVFGDLAVAAIGCPNGALSVQLETFDKIARSKQSVKWTIYGGGKLALELAGTGTLVFVKSDLDPGFGGAGSPLLGRTWLFGMIEQGGVSDAYTVAPGDGPRLSFSADGTVNGDDGCNLVRGTYRADDSTLVVHLNGADAFPCADRYSGAIDSVLTASKIAWQVSGTSLTLAVGTTKLIFSSDPAPHSTPTVIVTAQSSVGSLGAQPSASPLAGTKWVLDHATGPGGAAPHLIFGSDGSFQLTDACHSWSGKAVVSATTLRLTSATPNTSQLCAADASVEKALPLDGTAISWSRASGPLVIKHAGVTLTFLRYGL